MRTLRSKLLLWCNLCEVKDKYLYFSPDTYKYSMKSFQLFRHSMVAPSQWEFLDLVVIVMG